MWTSYGAVTIHQRGSGPHTPQLCCLVTRGGAGGINPNPRGSPKIQLGRAALLRAVVLFICLHLLDPTSMQVKIIFIFKVSTNDDLRLKDSEE